MFGFGACASKRHGAFGFAGPGFAGPWAHKERNCHGPMAILRDLHLTDDQLEKVARLKLESLAACAQLKLSLAPTIHQIVEELTADRIDTAKIKDLARQLKEQKSQIGETMLDRIVSFAEMLTPEQRKRLKLSAIKRFLDLDDPEE